MAAANEASFDQWVADHGGPEAVAAMIAEMRRQVEAGTLPSFTDKDEFLAHIAARRDRRSA